MADAMAAIGTALDTITGLRVYDFPPSSAQPPFAFVDMPEAIVFDLSMGRGHDRATFPVIVAVANVVDRAAVDAISAYAAASGASSVKAVLDAAAIGTSRRVESVEFRPVTLASGTYAGAIFQLDVVL
jgi:acetaldehyde dehydrogenase (acetylating)